MDKSLIDQVLSANNIVDVISGYLTLKKSGHSYKGVCPFHQDTNPSMHVSEKKQIFKCFACGKGGNAITFVRDYEKISFIEAVKKLALRVGITIPEDNKINKVVVERRNLIQEIYDLTNLFFIENLNLHGNMVLEYLSKRGISSETIKIFSLGYALNSFSGLKNYLLKKKFQPEILRKSGLFVDGEKGLYDLFRNRLMFPILSHTGKVIAFGGRKLDKDSPGGKYVNSPTTEIYQKGKDVYGLYLTKYDISKADYVLISEGYLDFLRLYENGFTNSVAALGTAFTDDQIRLVSRYTKNFYILLDGDNAGQKASLNIAVSLLKNKNNVKIVQLPEEEDPDSYLLKYGKDKLRLLIQSAHDVIEYLYYNQSLNYSKKDKIEYFQEIFKDMDESLESELIIERFLNVFKLPRNVFGSASKSMLNIANDYKQKKLAVDKNQEEKLLIHYFFKHPEKYKIFAGSLDSSYFVSNIFKKIFTDLFENGIIFDMIDGNPSSILNNIKNMDIINVVTEMLMVDIPEINIEELISSFEIRRLNNKIKEIDNKIRENSENLELFKEKQELKNRLNLLSGKVVKKTI